MNPMSCPHEASVLHAARTGCWDDFTRVHVAECPHCREIAQVAEWMGNEARAGAKECSLPDVEQVWLNARFLAMQAARERALRPVAIANLAMKIVLALALAGGVAWGWSSLRSITLAWLPKNLQILQPICLSVTALAACLVILIFIKLIQPMLIEE